MIGTGMDNLTHTLAGILVGEALHRSLPPSAATLESRLRGRSKDTEEQIARRLEVACREVEDYATYDYVVINDEVEACVDRLRSIVVAERARVRLMRARAERVIATFRKEQHGGESPESEPV